MADEMGLGKTLQCMPLLIVNADGEYPLTRRHTRHYLVVDPS
jgi:SNF2 family DNA or RNA helicase